MQMIVVRNCFIAKPGQASKLAAQFKEFAAQGPFRDARVLTDMSGEFNRVVFEHQVESLAALEALLSGFGANPQLQEKLKGYTELWSQGHRELLKLH
jgi:hypothetical protein